jgi:hypothetical protein
VCSTSSCPRRGTSWSSTPTTRFEADHSVEGPNATGARPERIRSAQVVCSGHAFVQNLRRGHYDLGPDTEPGRRLEASFTELALAI